jgi:general stress protein 26
MQHDQPAHETLWKLIKDIRFGMFTHHNAQGTLHGHPLTTQNTSIDENATLYFFVARQSEIASAISHDPYVCVTYADPGADSYVSASGEARIEEDQAKKDQLFTPMAKAWFPDGSADPNLALLTVRLRHAEYWDVDDSKMVQLFKFAKAALTGNTPSNLGEHKELRL